MTMTSQTWTTLSFARRAGIIAPFLLATSATEFDSQMGKHQAEVLCCP